MSAFINISGQRFGRLVAIKVVERQRRGTTVELIWLCQCDCGNTKRVKRSSLGKSVNSCGCLRKEITQERGRKNKGHGLPSGVAAKNKLYDKYRRQAGFRGLVFALSMEQFENLTQGDCYYCGDSPYQTTKEKSSNGQYTYNGIDRVDNNDGYVISNCVSCCGTCNKAKLSMSEDEFAGWADKVYHHFAQHKKPKTLFGLPITSATVNFQDDQTAKWYRDLFVEVSAK
jgi:hypothetical protein